MLRDKIFMVRGVRWKGRQGVAGFVSYATETLFFLPTQTFALLRSHSDPLISSAITVTITSNVTAVLEFSLIGQTVAVYDPVNREYAFIGLGVRARVSKEGKRAHHISISIHTHNFLALFGIGEPNLHAQL
jgi:hypothetical protein